GDVADVAAVDAPATEPTAAVEHRMLAAEAHQAADELEQLGVEVLPIEPGELVVLAVGVVVAALGAAELVPAEQHRYAAGEHQRRQEVPLLALAQETDPRIVGRPFVAAVPGTVVVGSVAVVLAVV